MKISYNWLQQFLKIDLEAEQVAEILTDLGLEVEGIEKFESVKGSLDGIVVGEVLTCDQHPNADRLKVTTVDVGLDKPLSIVCGAPNVAAGQKVPVAMIGTTLFSAEGEPWVIKKGKIRGEESHGMICAEDELGLGNSHDGIMILDKKIKVGTPAASVFEIFKDEVFEIGLTPNRADAMSHMGVARDLRAGLIQQYDINKELITPSVGDFNVDERTHKINVEVRDYNKTPRYAGVTLVNLTVAESPDWLKNRLLSIGQKPINNVVDVTNFVLHSLGQPLHAFDAKKIEEDKIIVKCLPTGTKFKTLDGVERILDEEDIMICDGASNPMCLAGIFGGETSGVTNKTTSIFLESAYFDPISIRKSAKRHGLNTDASFRFERGIDPENVEYALKLAAILIKKVAGGKIVSDVVDIYPKKIQDFQVHLSYEKANRLIGEVIPSDIIKNILASLDIKINNQTESGLGLTIPSYRVDVQREADIVEDILRVYGYNNIRSTTKLNTSISYSEKLSNEKIEGIISSVLVAQGFSEMMANSLTKADYVEMIDSLKEKENVKIVNALSKDLEVMRQSLVFGSLEAVAYNLNRKNANIKFFEIGKSYHKTSNGYEEKKHLALTVSGERNASSWNSIDKPTDFFYLKGICQAIFQRLGIADFEVISSENDIFSEGVGFSKNGKQLLELGLLNEKMTKYFGIKQDVWFVDFSWDVLMAEIESDTIKVVALPKYPEVKRDLALLLDQKVQFKDLYETAISVERNLLKKVDLFDVYTGDKLPQGKKSYALSFVLRDDNKTLTEKQIDKIMGKLQQSFKEQFEAELR
ncbi:phenylalanine--tRNA ligase subunit beta [Namhaeicola litoreus]|uniref:Phenylalanine--tRNA ligase beta subunit n=1 Tax=Namhaeicola litoreus TaxID=1052145 RepID=A0ABW3Y4Y5_9FLAO